jgi:voltage-gated potassium channel
MPLTPNTDAIEAEQNFGKPAAGWRREVHEVVFESHSPEGRAFDLLLIVAILASIAVVMADSMPSVVLRRGVWLQWAEYGFTALFTIEYGARLLSVQRPLRYATSFYGLIDLMCVLPTYLAPLVPEAGLLIDVRVLRLLRVFRIFRLTAYMEEFATLRTALAASRRKILVFLSFVLMVVLVMGTLMYVVEGPAHGFTSIPIAMYWAVTTMTTVGFGDITPRTDLGRLIASTMMLLGWGVLAVPTGIVTAEMTAQRRLARRAGGPLRCTGCGAADHEPDARYCRLCGMALQMDERPSALL